MIPDTQKPGGFHLAVHRRLAGLIGVAVLVVKGTGTAMLDQVPQRSKAGIVNHI